MKQGSPSVPQQVRFAVLLLGALLGGARARLGSYSSRRRVLSSSRLGRGRLRDELGLDGTFCQDANLNLHKHVFIRDRMGSSMCMPGMFEYRRELDALARTQPRHRNWEMANFEAAVRGMAGRRGFEKAAKAFEDIMYLEAQDVLALRETWTDQDTAFLKEMDGRQNAWTIGPLTTENVRLLLPSTEDLLALLANKSVAVVGSGPSITGKRLGKEIDQHAQVVRFNDHPMVPADTGSRTTMLVTNRWVDEGPRYQGLPLFDLEATGTLDSFCFRMNRFGRFHRMPRGVKGGTGPVFLIRPTARCAMRDDVGSFTRGFMFYWMFGSSFQDADLYGFGMTSGRGHLGPRKAPVAEPFLDFEHHFYQTLRDLQQKKRRLALSAAAAARGAAPPPAPSVVSARV